MSTGALRAERSERFQFIPMEVELHARAVHFGIASGPEKALRATESVKKVGQFLTLCKYQAKNAVGSQLL